MIEKLLTRNISNTKSLFCVKDENKKYENRNY